ncbi:MAG TPA: permease prefix domain 1-containing protein, partial [Longimicrobiales bacterium]|nr:permease prefix domain 1-containing protein [Longimicrobiales bacterium]
MKNEPIWRRYARLFGADPRADTEDELSFHYEMRVQDYMRRGLDEAGARAAARERMGDLNRVRVDCEAQDLPMLRRNRQREWLGDIGRDLGYGIRVLARTPGFALVAVLTLALGIGATTAIYSVVHRVLLAPLPYSEPDQLVRVWEVSPRGEDHNPVSPGNYVEWSTRTRS